VRAAPIWPCHRRALRPVPQAPERAFVVTRARDGKHFLRLAPVGLSSRGARTRAHGPAGPSGGRSVRARYKDSVSFWSSGYRGFGVSGLHSIYSLVRTLLPKKGSVFIVSMGLSFLKRVFLPGVHIHMLRGIHTLALGAPGCGVAAWHMQWRLERCGCELHPASKLAGPREGSLARCSQNAVQQAAQAGEQ
jgi:hypothetical protein